MQGAQKLRGEPHFHVRRSDEAEAQRRRWTFYETIKFIYILFRALLSKRKGNPFLHGNFGLGGNFPKISIEYLAIL